MVSVKYFLGLDIGTNSIGWAAADLNYKLLKFKGNKTWGSYIFDDGKPAADRRTHRVARRANERKKQRVQLLQELMAKGILEKDPEFFIRQMESALWADDKSVITRYLRFADTDYTDVDYNRKYPTIHHLIDDLMRDKTPHDIRLVYIALQYMLSHRGHFLSPVDEDNIEAVTDFGPVYTELMSWFESSPWDYGMDEFKAVLSTRAGINAKFDSFKKLLWNGKAPKYDADECEVDRALLVKLLCGSTIKLSALFNEDSYKELEKESITLNNADELDTILEQIESTHADLIRCCKNVFDWALLTDILNGKKTISEAKVAVYELHQKDLKLLKDYVRKYLPKKYFEVFRKCDDKLKNYTAYSGKIDKQKDRLNLKQCKQVDFCAYLKKLLAGVEVDEADKSKFAEMYARICDGTFCPKQVNTDNRVIPYQLYYYEMKTILANSCAYIPLLNERDEYGTVADKILSIMKFRVPYYVGPLNPHSNHSWIKRKAGKILPWNFDDMVDHEASEQEFIRRMTCKCTYRAGCFVLPKNSLLYSKFTVLNEINNIRINDVPISVACKQDIYNGLFMKRQNVTVKALTAFLESNNYMKQGDTISGLNDKIMSSLKPYLSFRNLLENKVLTEEDAERIILQITCTEEKGRLKCWLRDNYNLEEADVNYISGLKFKDFGRLSRELLTETYPVSTQTGEVMGGNIITALWETNSNLMQLIMTDGSGYKAALDMANRDYYQANPVTIADRLNEMYLSPAVRRSVIRTLDIVKDIRKCLGKAPEKIFLETTRELEDNGKKGKRTDSRRDKIINLYKQVKEDTTELRNLLDSKTDEQLRSEKLFLYFMQLGKCMYSGKAIDINELASKLYDIDHIFPQARVKDDSLDNKVLVLSEYNGAKSDIYPISSEIRANMSPMWDRYHKLGLITDKKYSRLTRAQGFTDDELAGFISRQIVETSQTVKAVSTLLKELLPETEIVYVKAGLVSEFRHDQGYIKCRDVNDLHHAKDAYLNIVIGNVYNTKFTKNPVNFIKSGKKERYSLKLSSLLFDKNGKSHRIERGGVVAWNDDGSTIETVKSIMGKNSIIYNKYSYVRKGELFDAMPLKAADNDVLLPRKDNLPVVRYGGYNSLKCSCFSLVKYHTDLGRTGIVVMSIDVMYLDKFIKDTEFAASYAKDSVSKIITLDKKEKSVDRVEFPLVKRLIKVGTMIEMDGFRAFLMSKSDKGAKIIISSASPLVLDNVWETYIKRLSNFKENSTARQGYKLTKWDGLSCEQNMMLFDILCEKLSNKLYSVKFSDMYNKISGKRSEFANLALEEQSAVLLSIVNVLKTNRSNTCDFSLLGLAKNSGIIKLSTDLLKNTNIKSIQIIDRSPAGLIEKRSPNLLTL